MLREVVLVSKQLLLPLSNLLTLLLNFLVVLGLTLTTANIYPGEARGDGAENGGDAVLPEGDVEEDATAAVSKIELLAIIDIQLINII